MSAIEEKHACEAAVRDAEAATARAFIAYENAPPRARDAKHSDLVRARLAEQRARDDLNVASRAALREDAAAQAATKRRLLAEADDMRFVIDRAWDAIIASTTKIAEHAKAIRAEAVEIERHVAIARAATNKASFATSEAGRMHFDPPARGVPTTVFAKLIVRAQLLHEPSIEEWVRSGRVPTPNAIAPLFRRARELVTGKTADHIAEEAAAVMAGEPGATREELAQSLKEFEQHKFESEGFP